MIMTVIGNRPQFIKMAPISRVLKARNVQECVIHTNQHYDHNMSGQFFDELGIPAPDIFLTHGGRTHATMTADMMVQLEKIMIAHSPKSVLVFGDTNSTLAAVLTAIKLNIPLAHAEAGPRTGDRTMPEEVNRIIADHMATLNFAPDDTSLKNLQLENLADRSYFVGDLMYDSFCIFSAHIERRPQEEDYVFMTIHRPINTDAPEALSALIQFIKTCPKNIKLALHPRTKQKFEEFGLSYDLNSLAHLQVVEPLGYLDTMKTLAGAAIIVTDSGGLQKEAYWSHKTCYLAQNISPWPQLEAEGWVRCIGCFSHNMPAYNWKEMLEYKPVMPVKPLFGDGHAAVKIADLLSQKGFV